MKLPDDRYRLYESRVSVRIELIRKEYDRVKNGYAVSGTANPTKQAAQIFAALKNYAEKLFDIHVEMFIQAYREWGECPDNQDAKDLGDRLNSVVGALVQPIENQYTSALSPIPIQLGMAQVESLKQELKQNVGIALGKLHTFILEEQVNQKSMSSMQSIDLSFIADAEMKRIIERDYKELLGLDPTTQAKSVLIISGSIIEGLLIDALVANGDYPSVKDCDKFLKELIHPAKKAGIVKHDNLSDVVRIFRNLAHPAREVRECLTFDQTHAIHSRAAVDVIITEVREWYGKRTTAS